ncbi:hypothetical protein AB0910_06250 [Streptomyces sp. NPDC047002]|uniref:hypothetical protein n=1 Tax=Streptomyces sp. NPDC047002 TaxID=3155475 RepID=UPI0034528DA5
MTLIEPVVFHTGLMASSPQARRDDAYDHAREALFAGAAHILPGPAAAPAPSPLLGEGVWRGRWVAVTPA